MKDKFIRNTIVLFVIAFVCIAVPAVLMDLPLGMPLIDAYTAQIITLAGVNAIMAISVNVICGITGQLSLGQAGFQALGAYSVIILTEAGIPLPVSILLGGLINSMLLEKEISVKGTPVKEIPVKEPEKETGKKS